MTAVFSAGAIYTYSTLLKLAIVSIVINGQIQKVNSASIKVLKNPVLKLITLFTQI